MIVDPALSATYKLMNKLMCLKCTMGDWTYYVSSLSFAEAAENLKFAHQVNKRTDLDHLIQRELTSRSQDIAEYLRHQRQRMFGALICASFGGPLSFNELQNGIGELTLDATQPVYVLDGQHRLAAIQEVITENPTKYKNDRISIVLVFHGDTDAGYQRARRLFTTVNRYAKQTSKTTNRVMDEDDGVSYLLLRFVREFTFFTTHIKILRKNRKGQTLLAQSESIGKGDSKYLMSVSSFYEVIFNLLPTIDQPIFKQRQKLPAIGKLDDGYGEVEYRIDEMFKVIDCWEKLRDGTLADLSKLRGKIDGHPLVRPVAIIPFARAFNEARETGVSLKDIRSVIEKYNNITKNPWLGLLWDPSRKRMYGGQEVKRITYRVWRVLLGLADPKERKETNELWRSAVDPHDKDPQLKLP